MMDAFQQVRRKILRRTVFATNVHAMRAGAVSPDGSFDAAAANALAVLASYESDEAEYDNGGRVKAPLDLLRQVSRLVHVRDHLPDLETKRLRSAILESQKFRHGRADDEWARLEKADIESLAYLDEHPGLGVLEVTKGMSFDEAVVALWGLETNEHVEWDRKLGDLNDVIECPECWRLTLVTSGYDDFGIGPGQGRCIACGYLRTDEEAFDEALAFKIKNWD